MRTIDDIRFILYMREDKENPVVGKFRALAGKEIFECADDRELEEVLESLKARGAASKETVILKRFMGRTFQKCPGSSGVICCNYYLINTCFNCLYDCTYCYLNYYLNSFGIIQFINADLSLADAACLREAEQGPVIRIGTGEYTDSLMFDEVTGIGSALIAEAARYPGLFLEMKTKSDNITHLLKIREKGNAVLAWSLNTAGNIELYEKGTAALDERIAAAAAACGAGYLTAFHFDPIITENARIDAYLDIVDILFEKVDPARVAWISMGCFRYSPGFKEIITALFPEQRLTTAEMFPGPDGKFRYLKKTRVAIYRAMLERIRAHTEAPFIYLCMESEGVWRDVFNVDYSSSSDLESAFSRHLKNAYFLNM